MVDPKPLHDSAHSLMAIAEAAGQADDTDLQN